MKGDGDKVKAYGTKTTDEVCTLSRGWTKAFAKRARKGERRRARKAIAAGT